MKRIGLLTGGGDAPGLNAVIRSVVRTAETAFGAQVLGIRDGFDGLLAPDGIVPLQASDVVGILGRGGTILGTANRGNPFARQVMRDGQEVVEDVSGDVLDAIHALDLEALIVVGGDGTLHISLELHDKGCPIIGVPKTIDNDIGGTDFSFGFDTALNTAMEALDRLQTTAEAHHCVMVLELMGCNAGYIALHAGLAGGADVILIPEIPFDLGCVAAQITKRTRRGRAFSLVAAAEGAHTSGGEPVYRAPGDGVTYARLGGIGHDVAMAIAEMCGVETRNLVLGHLQRGGSPTAFDRWLGTCFGAAAVHLAAAGSLGRMTALRQGEIVDIGLAEALARPRHISPDNAGLRAARSLGVCLGDGGCL